MKTYTASCDECPWEGGPYRTQGQADYGYRSHSCDRWKARAAAHARGLQREAQVDRTPKPCHHKYARHEHGTHACYVADRCRCRPCADANTTYERQRVRAHAYGRWNGYVDAQPARDHLITLRDHGLGLKTVAQRAGLSESTLGKIVYGDPSRGRKQSKRIRPATEAKILAVKPGLDTLAGGAKIDGTGTRRRLQALVAMGWSQSRLARQLGYNIRNFNYLIHGKREVTATTARRARIAYELLWDKQPPTGTHWERGARTRALGQARANGWVSPLAWDDDTIDDPNATPDLGEPEVGRHSRQRFTIDDVEFLLSTADYTRDGLAARLGVRPNSILVACRRADRLDLWDRLIRNETGELRQEAS